MNITLLDSQISVDTLANILTLIVGVLAIFLTFIADQRTRKREMDVAAASVKPLLAIETDGFENAKGVILVNHGLGTAIITKITVARGAHFADNNNIADLMYNEGTPPSFDNYSSFTPGHKQYIDAGMRLYLAKLTDEALRKKKYSVKRRKEFLSRWKQELRGIEIIIEYTDLFNTKQETYKREF